VRPGDIMILVRRRDAFFDAMIRALREKNVPAAGADRLKLGQHIAVMDLAAVGRAALLPDDDLTLATALKTPLFGLDDDDLIRVAPLRPGSLHAALRAAPDRRLQEAVAWLDLLRALARALPPFAFYARLLGPLGGRRAFLSRLGPEAGDALDEFLNLALAHERARAPSLVAFLAEVAALEVEIKRDMDLTSSFVRVMTVHAAKGLEAKIVFLPDVCAAPGGREGALYGLAGGSLVAWSPKKELDCAAVAASRLARRDEAAEEYRRLLYVAMTRAEERLYIGGHRGVRQTAAESWRTMIDVSLGAEAVEVPAPWGGDATVLRYGPQDEPPRVERDAEPAPAAPQPAPDWLFRPAPLERAVAPPLRPSGALEGADEAFPAAAPASPSRAAALEEGRLAHRLLEHLPDLPRGLRRAAALRELAARGLAPARAEGLAGRVLAILDDARLAPLFGPASVAEARLAARLERPGGGFVDIAGAIDRMAETPAGVWLADYKTGAPSPERRPAYVAQLALYRAAVSRLYPGRPARCFLIHASGPVVDEIAPAEMDEAADRVLRSGRLAN
jgi:ATP-dependent helicase/nuclease subunit A